ncbi:MAG TPA: CYTH domain-containing protein [Gammaproteobacteria bacterium]
MGIEIERKFLAQGDGWRAAAGSGTRMRQGYVVVGPSASVRVRMSGEHAWLGIKSMTAGVTRAEFEYEIPRADADRILDHLCSGVIIEKTRYRLEHGDHVWVIDVFDGENAGLIVAEIELSSESEVFSKPDWAGEEVSHDPRYYNAVLSERPYRTWDH